MSDQNNSPERPEQGAEGTRQSPTVEGPMTAIVEFEVPADEMSMDEWLTLWGPRGDDARDFEPETCAYEAMVSVEDPTRVLAYERYTTGDAGLAFHMQRPSHAEIARALGDSGVNMKRTFISKFVDLPGYGWWSRPERQSVFANEGALVIFLGMNFAGDAERDAFIEISGGHADYCREAEPETLVYSGGLSVADQAYGVDVEADLVFVMACTDLAAMEQHRDDPRHLALGEPMAKAGCMPDIAFTKTYRTTAKGYLWK